MAHSAIVGHIAFVFCVLCVCVFFLVSRTSQLCLLKGARSRNLRQFQYRLTGHRIDLNVITTVCSYRKPLKKRRWAKLEARMGKTGED